MVVVRGLDLFRERPSVWMWGQRWIPPFALLRVGKKQEKKGEN
jgi:hypothetical protein